MEKITPASFVAQETGRRMARERAMRCVRFCAGYELPEGVTLADVLGALQFYQDAWEGHPGDSGPGGNWPADPEWNPDEALLEDGGQKARAILAAFTKEDG